MPFYTHESARQAHRRTTSCNATPTKSAANATIVPLLHAAGNGAVERLLSNVPKTLPTQLSASSLRLAVTAPNPSNPLAVTQHGITTFAPAVAKHPLRDHIEAHEAVHRAQFAAHSILPAGTHSQLESDAADGASALLRGLQFSPAFSARPGERLNYEPTAGAVILFTGDFEIKARLPKTREFHLSEKSDVVTLIDYLPCLGPESSLDAYDYYFCVVLHPEGELREFIMRPRTSRSSPVILSWTAIEHGPHWFEIFHDGPPVEGSIAAYRLPPTEVPSQAAVQPAVKDDKRSRGGSHWMAEFGKRYSENWMATNEFFWIGPTRFSRSVLGILLSGAVAKELGTVTWVNALKGILFKHALSGVRGLGPLTVSETITAGIFHSIVNSILVAIALEAGIALGSAIDAALMASGIDLSVIAPAAWKKWSDFIDFGIKPAER